MRAGLLFEGIGGFGLAVERADMELAWHSEIDRHASAVLDHHWPLECERLQGFPDGWTDIPGNSDTQRYRQLGNAVAVPVVEWIMRRIAEAV